MNYKEFWFSLNLIEFRDFTAKLYNNEELPDVNVTYEAGPSNEPAGSIGPKIPSKMKDKKKKVDPMMEPTGTAPDKWDKVNCKGLRN